MIDSIDLAKLRNSEFVQFGSAFSGFVGENNPVTLNVDPQFQFFNNKLDEMSGLFKLERASPITQALVLIDERRDKAINGIGGVIESYCNHFDGATSQAAKQLLTVLNLYGVGVARLNTQAETSTIKAIVKDWDSKPEFGAAILKLGLVEWVSELITANQLFESTYADRTREYGAANSETLKAKRAEAMLAYYELRKFIDANSVINPSAAIEKLINEVNSLIEQYNTLLNTRPSETKQENDDN
jgi:hypothetical protein